MAEPIISVSGLRGIVGESFSPAQAVRFSGAFASTLPEGPIVVTRDGRATGSMIAQAVHSAVRATGHDVIDAGIAATPTTGVLVRSLKASGGIQISASHNPPSYNGVKLFSGAGRVLPAIEGEKVLARYRTDDIAWAPHLMVGKNIPYSDTIYRHLQLVLARIDLQRIRSARFRVLLDANHGAGSILGEKLLAELGCEAIILGGTPDGAFAHPPEPTAENLQAVGASVREHQCVVGFCQDPDADRLALIDESGSYIGEEYTVALCLDHELRRAPGPVVTNCSTSRMSEDLAKKYGVPFYRSAVGEANVVDTMLAHNASFGGEGNGGPIDPQVGLVRDSFIGMVLVLDALAARKLPISQLAAELPRYEIYKDKVTMPRERIAPAFDALERRFSDARVDRLDGLRLDWSDRWLIVRGSNTEPIVRMIAEAPTLAAAKELCEIAGRELAAT